MPRPRNRLTAALKVLHKEKPKAVRRSDKTAFPSRWKIPSGSFDLDHRLGGGIKVGGVTMYWGEKSGGKTTTALRNVAHAQAMCRNCWRPARADRWTVVKGLIAQPTEESLVDILKDATEGISRREAHDLLVEEGYELVPYHDEAPLGTSVGIYGKEDGVDVVTAAVIRIPGLIEDVPPPEGTNKDERWTARGWCDCALLPDPEHEGERMYAPEEGSEEYDQRDQLIDWGYLDKKPPLNSKAHREARDEMLLDLALNSYEEVVCNWVDMEGTLDLDWATKLGVRVKRLLLTLPDSAEEAIDIIAALCGTAEVDLQIIDSIAQLAPQKELASSVEDWQQGLMARLMNKAIRIWNQGIISARRHEYRALTQIWINQKRVSIGVMFGSPDTMPGGLGQGFQVVSEVKWRHGKTEKTEEQYGAKHEKIERAVWETLHFEVTKSKGNAAKGLKGNYRQAMSDTDAYPAGTVLDYERVFKLAMDRLVEQRKKGSKKVYVLGDREYTSQSAISADMQDDPAFYHEVRSTLLDLEIGGS